ncbi:MAG TPA: MBL fold metallo-hydrolase [Anaerolineae bacterium]|nr:MBL fold metallo-hydrolase [Anaerolineae bacterium]
MSPEQTAFAGYPSAVVYGEPLPGKVKGKKPRQQLIWGDWLTVKRAQGDWREVGCRGPDGWVHESLIQQERLLEVNFVDVGQGDGCLIVTPGDRFILVDAGAEDNMYRFLSWRFNFRRFPDPISFEAAIITHPDEDHYYGFKYLFEEQKAHFGCVHHNGIVERVADKRNDRLGPRWQDASNGLTYLTDVVTDLAGLRRILDDSALAGDLQYPSVLKLAADSGRVGDIRALCSDDGYMPGYEADKELSIQVLGPVTEAGPGGQRYLRWFRDVGKTKNGHSLILRLAYGDVSVLLGGDLNTRAEEYLLSHYTGLPLPASTAVEQAEVIRAGRSTFETAIAKVCHHGSADFTDVFLQAVNPDAWVVSSGDAEPHCHPRPDSLGALGKHGRGARPLIFSTELARSAEENIRHPYQLRKQLKKLQKAIDEAETPAQKQRAESKFEEAIDQLERSVAVYGMISLRTDGRKVLMAQKLERRRSRAHQWDLQLLEPGPDGRPRHVSGLG